MKIENQLFIEKANHFYRISLEFFENIIRNIFNLDKRFLVIFFLIIMSFGLFTTIVSNAIAIYGIYEEAKIEEDKLESLLNDIKRLTSENAKFKTKKGGETIETIFNFKDAEELKVKEHKELEKIIALFNSNSYEGLKIKIISFEDDLESNTFKIKMEILATNHVLSIVAIDYISKYCYVESFDKNLLIARIIQEERKK